MESIADRYRHAARPGGNAALIIMLSQNKQQDIDRKAAGSDYRINVGRSSDCCMRRSNSYVSEVLKPTEAIRMLTELLEQSTSDARESDAESEPPS